VGQEVKFQAYLHNGRLQGRELQACGPSTMDTGTPMPSNGLLHQSKEELVVVLHGDHTIETPNIMKYVEIV